VLDVPNGVVTVTQNAAAFVTLGETAVIVVSDTTTTLVAAGFTVESDSSVKVTLEPATKLVPVIVIVEPPEVEPVFFGGVMPLATDRLVSVGAPAV
jgi:hypothetical protein